MSQLFYHRAATTPLAAQRTLSVCVVDSQVDSYADWNAEAKAAGIRLSYVDTVGAALRLARSQAVDLWVVNMDLPDATGEQLCSMLRSHSPHVPVFAVSEQYSEAGERSAYRAGARLFGVKPAHRDWLGEWTRSHHAASRSGRTPVAAATF